MQHIILANLFARIWSEFEDPNELNLALKELSKVAWTGNFLLEQQAALIGNEDAIIRRTSERLKSLRLPKPLSDGAVRLFIAQSIDEWHEPLFTSYSRSPNTLSRLVRGRESTSEDAIRDAWLRLALHGRLNDAPESLQIVPKYSAWERSKHRDEPHEKFVESTPHRAFGFLTAFPATLEVTHPDGEGLQPAPRVRVRYTLSQFEPRRRSLSASPRIGVAPLAQTAADIPVAVAKNGGGYSYDARAVDLSNRAREALRSLCAAGASIIIFPEASVHPSTLAAIKQAIIDFGGKSDLRLVVAGTAMLPSGQIAPNNKSVLFDRRGNEIATQSKLHRWNIKVSALKGLGVETGTLDNEIIVKEGIEPGDVLEIFEHDELGRLSVLICEDISRSSPSRWLRSDVCLDWIFTPIFDDTGPGPWRGMTNKRWMVKSGLGKRDQRSARVVIANSTRFGLVADASSQASGSWALAALIEVDGDDLRMRVVQRTCLDDDCISEAVDWTPEVWKN